MPRYNVYSETVEDGGYRALGLHSFPDFTERPDDVIAIPVAELDERIDAILAARLDVILGGGDRDKHRQRVRSILEA
jgi:hypothetical protein